ncbi:flagellar motor switch protein FliM [Brachyspira hyodysenteriae]|uniref:Flagellar motor switch protein FliM n=10 Tax=Brachyspira TaxID=29521 RepID=A0A1E5NHN0_9SPIR|nr:MULTISPECIES: flagellar motor switch protein FliM [Brachyspira]ACN83868.1 flagellar motor switch protein FliM [Brachyspira hyodysenteriae WA1]ADG72016.1 flagellar motor switch protein FliM [Brachyspira murdochii DSM 12563]AEM21092.1 flagellar motor switch protein FliM [Brachyspira intermedia PWS/A]ANN64017.1 flagellar motor switch protein FliM [Brachyspira hyodysenteriae ATCC 27164]ASJ21888.1 flagellar motor switch protein FliM [Brachyspira hampsonii]
MTEVLSQSEIDALLSAISSGESLDNIDTKRVEVEHRKIKIYDFKRPDKFSKDQIRTLQMMHENFARVTTTSLSAQLRTLVGIHVASVDQLTYEEFIRSVSNPSTLAIVSMDPLKGSSILEIDPSITFTIIDRLFGGPGESPKNLNRELTDIELSVMEGIIVRILGNLREAWSQVIDLRPRLGSIETNPQFAQMVSPNDMVVLITLETKVADVEGMMNFCIPYITIEPILSKFSAQYWYASIRRGSTSENLKIIKEKLQNIFVETSAELGSMQLPLSDILNLQKGDVVKFTDTKITDPVIFKIGNRKKFLCRPGISGSRMAVQLTGVMDGEADITEDDLLKEED